MKIIRVIRAGIIFYELYLEHAILDYIYVYIELCQAAVYNSNSILTCCWASHICLSTNSNCLHCSQGRGRSIIKTSIRTRISFSTI